MELEIAELCFVSALTATAPYMAVAWYCRARQAWRNQYCAASAHAADTRPAHGD